ncbi:serine protease gd-like [Anopheles nili]|uniref:serine protease gd-like n=1 Tax=Anopheles nili TaxID=185578 RepID=UPI00237BF8D2|nr:serine protease gd-like [Anopheles nili]
MDKSYRVRAGEIVIVKFYVRYSTDRPVPLLRQIRFNGQNICTDTRSNPVRPVTSRPAGTRHGTPNFSRLAKERVTSPSTRTTTTPRSVSDAVIWHQPKHLPLNADLGFSTLAPTSIRPSSTPGGKSTPGREQFFAGDYAFLQTDHTPSSPAQPHYINQYEDDICGTVVPKANPLVTHGSISERGQFPWHGALYRSTVTELKYLCGATLISRRAAITAAHCVTLEKSSKPVDAGSLLLYFGKIDLGKWNGPEEDAQIRTVHIPAQYAHERFFNDIAVLVLKEDIKYSNFVRPICLWNFDDDYKTLINKIGLVPGWGYNEHGLVSSRLSFAQMPVVAHETCIWSNRDFFSKVTSDTSFCAGFKNGTSVCNGDSGGGMVFKHNNLWYLRGIVSVSAALQDRFRCDARHYVVFTDAAKFTPWIKNLM